MKKIILGRVLAFGLMFGMACTMMPNTVIKAAVESNSTEETVHIGDNEFTSYEELESGLKNVANVQQDSDTGIITVTMQKNVVGRICFDIKGAHIIFDGNGKTLSGQGYEEPICLQNFKHSIVELVGGGIYKTGYNNCIYTGAEDKLIIRNAVIIGNLSPYSDNYAGLENGYKSYSVMRLNETGDYVVNSQGMQLKNWVEDVNLYGLVDRDFAVVPTNNEHVHAKHLTKVEEKEATCTENGNKEYYKCSCGELFADKDAQKEITLAEVEIEAKGHEYETEYTKDAKYHWKKCKNCDAVTEKQEHTSSGEATEETAEICNVCRYVIHPELEHIHTRHLTKVEAKAATCTENGNKAYYKCSCGELFADKDAQKEITLAEVEIEAKGHEYETEYTKDAKYHWKKCKNCDAVTEKQEHTSSGEATEETAEICTECGYVMNPALEHIHTRHLTKVEAKAATCTENGNKAYYKCSCGELFADKDAQKEITLAEVEIEAKGHEYETEYTKDAKYHWKKCKNCDAVTEKQEHTSSGEATEETAEICTECGYVMNPALEHIHTRHLTKVEAKAATCTENGNKAYYKCSCGELFADKDAQKEITLAEVEIEAKGHEYETEYTKDAKYHWKKCKNCDAVTEKQEHTSSGAATEENAETCTVCGYVIHEKLQKESNDSSMQWQTLNKAKLVTEKAFADYKAGKESNKSDIANVVAQALKENSLSNVAYEIISYEKTEPTSATEGKISGIVSLAIGGCSTLIPFDYVITKVAEPQKPAQITGKGAQTTDGQIKISWIKADGADGYRIYASVCDGESNYKLIKDTKDLTGAIKNLNNKKSYKFYVVAYKNVDGKKVRICKSMIYHVVLSDSKYTNVKAIKVAKTSYTLNVGDKQKLNAKSVKQEKNKKLLTHAQEFRYSSSDTTVATVSKTGEITAKQSGSCIIYVVANNGVMKKIKVNVA